MSNRYFIIIILSYLLIANSIIGQKKIANTFIPPLKLYPYLAGSFGELRSNHFHSGIDFKTNGKTGYPIYAIENGYISRINVSPVGYGKALYINHDNGYTSVYGHLDEFSNNIDSLLTDYQYLQNSFSVNFFPKNDFIRVKKGDIVAYSGNTGGSSGPHLHFEIRDSETQKPINPLLFYSHVKDNIQPVIRRIRVFPISENASVNGNNMPITFSVAKSNGQYVLSGSSIIYASAKIGVGVDVVDFFNDSRNKCGVYKVQLFANDKIIYESELDQFGFDETRYINSFIDYAYKTDTKITIQKSFLEPNNKLNIYNNVLNKGIIDISPDSVYNFKYLISDISGNKSVLYFKIIGVPQQSFSKDEGEYIPWYVPFSLLNNIYKVKIDKNSFYNDVLFDVSVLPRKTEDLSYRIRVGDEHIPLQKEISIEIKVPDSIKTNFNRLALAIISKNGEKIYQGGSFNNGWMSLNTRNLGTYTLAIDTIPPTISFFNSVENNNYNGQKYLQLIIKDNYSGIDTYRCEVDGKWELFEYDLKTNRLICPLQKTKIVKGKQHQLIVKVKDGCGNAATKTLSFYY
ncbi:MAG: M23 family metallopeptidase [Marinilabiliaceae bacterium]|nr:M23 family metallopeptidase [Marinilabiliaceae bacterium]